MDRVITVNKNGGIHIFIFFQLSLLGAQTLGLLKEKNSLKATCSLQEVEAHSLPYLKGTLCALTTVQFVSKDLHREVGCNYMKCTSRTWVFWFVCFPSIFSHLAGEEKKKSEKTHTAPQNTTLSLVVI